MKKRVLASVVAAGLLAFGASGVAVAQPDDDAGRRRHPIVETAASTIGVSPQELGAEIRSGKTVAEVATEHGVDPQAVIDALVAAGTQRIDEALAAGEIDEATAAERKEKLPDRAAQFVNETKRLRPPRCGERAEEREGEPRDN